MKEIKIIANYLPQFHETEENNQWWGKGYTDWVAVKKAKPVYNEQIQPRIPCNNNYYDLTKKYILEWQISIAKKYGIYGFGLYHYWFNKDMNLLYRPADVLLANKDLDINFMFIWDNATWKRTWSNVKGYANDWVQSKESNDGTSGILAELNYGDKDDWKIHFNYLLPFFLEERYIKIDNKPVIAIFNQYNNEEKVKAMAEYWNQLAIENGFPGIYIIGRYVDGKKTNMDYEYIYEPSYSAFLKRTVVDKIKDKFKKKILKHDEPEFYQYDEVWERIIKFAKKNSNKKIFYGAISAYDDTPRRGMNAKIILNSTPSKFRSYLKTLADISLSQGKEYIFLTAWNEWGEGAYLEPDETNGYAYLEALKAAIDECQAEK